MLLVQMLDPLTQHPILAEPSKSLRQYEQNSYVYIVTLYGERTKNDSEK